MRDTLGKVLFVCFFAFVGYVMWTGYQEKKDSQNWPETKGYLISAHVKEVSERNEDANGFGHTSRHFTVVLDYTYTVGGHDYSGTRIRIMGDPNYQSEQEAVAAMREWQRPTTLTVFYNPKDPAKSTLTR